MIPNWTRNGTHTQLCIQEGKVVVAKSLKLGRKCSASFMAFVGGLRKMVIKINEINDSQTVKNPNIKNV